MTTAMLRPEESWEHRTTRPWHITRTSRSDPKTSPGIATVNSTTEPTATSDSLRNKIPPAEISMVSAWCSAVVVFSVTGRCSGNRTALRKSGWVSGFIIASTLRYIQSHPKLKLLKYHRSHLECYEKMTMALSSFPVLIPLLSVVYVESPKDWHSQGNLSPAFLVSLSHIVVPEKCYRRKMLSGGPQQRNQAQRDAIRRATTALYESQVQNR